MGRGENRLKKDRGQKKEKGSGPGRRGGDNGYEYPL